VQSLRAEDIAERAGISRRTFFNYFPTIESALFVYLTDYVDVATKLLRDRPEDEPAIVAIVAAINSVPTDIKAGLERMVMVVTRSSERPLAVADMAWENGGRAIREAIIERLPPTTETLLANAIAASITAAARTATEYWALNAPDAELHTVVAKALGVLTGPDSIGWRR
jgi:AcrR family transcriptional regulator